MVLVFFGTLLGSLLPTVGHPRVVAVARVRFLAGVAVAGSSTRAGRRQAAHRPLAPHARTLSGVRPSTGRRRSA